METEKVISINTVGEKSGRAYSGSFTVKMMMSQKDEFSADLIRRQIIGPSPDGTPPAANLQYKAYIMGMIQARATVVPLFWENSNMGMDIPDGNISLEVYDLILKAEEDFTAGIAKDSEKALKKLKKADKKAEAEADSE